MAKKSLMLVALLLTAIMLLLCKSRLPAQDSYPPEMSAAAKRALDTLMSSSHGDVFARNHYISPGERFETVTLGEPYAEYALERDKLLKLQACDSFRSCLRFVWWRIPIYSDDQPRTLLAMRCRGGTWKWADVGGDPEPFMEARRLWPLNDGYTVSYVVDLGGLDYFMIERGKDIGLYCFREETEEILGIRKDASGRFPLLTIPYVVQKLKAERRPHSNPPLE